uniref:Sec-independent protein translocase component TatC n=1 Tax=Hydropuntia eucheumatoides TaxID=172970 RepID=UPI002E765CCF|nr:Sec-independent protein translocase component TatC [Gracilaria eucheumatoides]WPS66056.1 Sec-independent protein translocase component TatC [Gracilaria eucheumatoides]
MVHRLIYFYSLELIFRFIYICISFLLCISVASFNSYYLLFFEVYPFIKLGLKKFIITNVMDLFNTLWLLTISKSLIFVLPYWIFHLYKFSSSSWYSYQLKFFKQSLFFSFFFSLTSLIIFNLSFLPPILSLLTTWSYKSNNLFYIFAEFRIISYIKWVLLFQYFIGYISLVFFLLILQLQLFIKLDSFYFLAKYYRKFFVFGIICILFILIPPDGLMQGLVIGASFLILEIVFLFVCYKLCNKKFI